jgi:hypothetical protein
MKVSLLFNVLLILLLAASITLLLVKTQKRGHFIALIVITGLSEGTMSSLVCHAESHVIAVSLITLFVHTPYAIGAITYSIQVLFDDAPPSDPFWDGFYIVTMVFGTLSVLSASVSLGFRVFKSKRPAIVIVIPETPITSQDNLVAQRIV